MILLTACNPVSFNPNCGLLFDYNEDYQVKVASQMKELKQKGGYNETLGTINDYAKTRDSIRACLAHKVNN